MSDPSFLVIRRDNIGDLVCTTPLLRTLRQHFPTARIDALVNSYNQPVLTHNPDINHVYAYTKAKHRPPGKSVAGVYWDRAKLLWQMRATGYDYAILASCHFLARPLRLARSIKPRHIIGFTEPGFADTRHIDLGIPYSRPHPMHQVEELAALLKPLGIDEPMPAMRVCPDPAAVARAQQTLEQTLGQALAKPARLIGVHISARKVSQRWSVASFVELMHTLHAASGAAFMLFWSPGDEDNPLHPGDDRKAQAILEACQDLPVCPYPTRQLSELIAGLALTDRVVCSDGGAMHLAAGVGKPIVCFFGQSDASMWYPWHVPHELLQPDSREVKDISPQDALAACLRLEERLGTPLD